MKTKLVAYILIISFALCGLCFGQNTKEQKQQMNEANIMLTELVKKQETLKHYNDKLADTAYATAVVIFEQGNFQEAESKFIEALQYNPDHEKAQSMYSKCKKINKAKPSETLIIQSPETEAVKKLTQDPIVRQLHNVLGRLDLFRNTPKKGIIAKVIKTNKAFRILIINKNFTKNTWLFIAKNNEWIASAVVHKTGSKVSAIRLDHGFPQEQLDSNLTVSNIPPLDPEALKKAFMKKLRKKDRYKLIPSLIIIMANFGDRNTTPTTVFASELLRKCTGKDFGYRPNAELSVKRKALVAWLDWWEENKRKILKLKKFDTKKELELKITQLYKQFRRSDSKNIWQQVENKLKKGDFESHKLFANHILKESEPLARVLGFCILVQASDVQIVEYMKKDLANNFLPIKEFIQILSTTDNKKFIPVLKILHDSQEDHQEKMLLCNKALDLGATVAIRWLIQLLESPDPTIGLLASTKLRILTLENFGFSINATDKEKKKTIQKWQKWWKKNKDSFTLPESSLKPNTN